MNKLSVIAAMVLGGLVACSTLATAQNANSNGKKGGKRGMPTVEQQLDRMSERLNLTDEQKPKVKEVLEQERKKWQELRSDSSMEQSARREKFQEIRKDSEKKMKAILTEEQFKKYQEMSSRRGKKGGKKKSE